MPATLRAIPPPARRVIRGPRRAKSRSKSRRAPGAERDLSLVGAHPVRERRPQGGLLGRGRAQGALLQGRRQACGWRIDVAGWLFVGAHPVRDKPTERYTPAWLSRTGCAPTDKRQARHKVRHLWPKADAQRGPALSPQRFGRVAQRTEVPAVWPPMGVPQQPSSNAQAYPSTMLRALWAIFFGLLFFWASKRKVTRAAAAVRNARRVGGQIAVTRQPETDETGSQPALG
jgi:hypothetical protein